MTRHLALTLVLLLSACGDDDGGPEEPQYQGSWSGTYTNSSQPEVIFQALLQLTQDDEIISGTLTTNAGRTATVSGEVSGDLMEATFTYTDQCGGLATSTADLVDETIPPSLTGEYTLNDCLGETSGEYDLIKSE